MENVTEIQHKVRISGQIIATDVSYEDFLKDYDGQYVEWVAGAVVRMSPVNQRHDAIALFLSYFLGAYLGLTGGGRVLQEPMTMRARPDLPGRSPDLQVLLPHNLDIVKSNQVDGPANLVIEIISPESDRRDRVEKFSEYERGGVQEYWIIDPMHHEVLFYVLGEDGVFTRQEPDVTGVYHSRVLNDLSIKVDILWRESLPDFWETARMVEMMVKG